MIHIVIQFDETTGQMNINASDSNKMRCCWILELARDEVKKHEDPSAGHIALVPPGMRLPMRNGS
ncbi:MAG TPA: hypothetical protein VGQ44_17390 [Gemmatimonadaceae bacterium]|jgi:hypothetical protein|nr:hypothetical protein [Gemmatimonadaceae bacterium]